MGSVSPKKPLEHRSQLDVTTADVELEAPHSAQLSPDLTLSSTGAVDSVMNGSCNILPGRAVLTGNQSLGRTFPENADWSVQRSGDSTPSLPPAPPPTDISGVHDSNGSFWPDSNGPLWPLFPTDTNWQSDFDIPLTSEPHSASIGTVSTAWSELDLSQVYNQATQGSDATEISRELIDYLSLSGKVSTNATMFACHSNLYTTS